MAQDLLDRIGAKLLVGDECWEYTGRRGPDGYHRISYKNRSWLLHRVMYALMVGPIPEGLDLDHLCRNRGCVRPSHLEPVTRSENLRRGLNGVLKTHCVNGHEYTPENTYRGRNGGRVCRTCTLAAQKLRTAAKAALRPPKSTLCPLGHDQTDEANIYRWKGRRYCRPCRNLASRRCDARRKARA